MTPFLGASTIILGLSVGTWSSLADEPKRPVLMKQTGPCVTNLVCSYEEPKKNGVYRIACHEQGRPACVRSVNGMPLATVMRKLGNAKLVGVRLKPDGCHDLTVIGRIKPRH